MIVTFMDLPEGARVGYGSPMSKLITTPTVALISITLLAGACQDRLPEAVQSAREKGSEAERVHPAPAEEPAQPPAPGPAAGPISASEAPPQPVPTASTTSPGGWQALFDGSSLDGWTPKIRTHAAGEDPYATFRVEEGLLKVAYDQYGGKFDRRFGHLFYDVPFSNYLLRVEYRFVGDQLPDGPGWARRNSGLMLHGQDPASMTLDQEFPVSIEVQLLGGDGQHKRPNANLCTPGTNVAMGGKVIERHCTNSKSETCHGEDWYEVTVEVRGGKVIRHFQGDDLVLEYQDPQLDPRDADAQRLIQGEHLILKQGTISLQSESHPIHFRRVEIKLLKP